MTVMAAAKIFYRAGVSYTFSAEHFVTVRTLSGGVAPEATEQLLDNPGKSIAADEELLSAAKRRLEQAKDSLRAAVESYV